MILTAKSVENYSLKEPSISRPFTAQPARILANAKLPEREHYSRRTRRLPPHLNKGEENCQKKSLAQWKDKSITSDRATIFNLLVGLNGCIPSVQD